MVGAKHGWKDKECVCVCVCAILNRIIRKDLTVKVTLREEKSYADILENSSMDREGSAKALRQSNA